MVLLLQLGAVLAAGLFVALAWTSSLRPADVARSLVVVACAFAYIAFWSHLSQQVDSFRAERIQWRSAPPEQAQGMQHAWPFAEWIRARIHPGDRFYLVPSATRDEAVYQWFTYRLLPSLATAGPQQAEWLIFYGSSPRQSGLIHAINGVAERFAPGYSLARTNRAR